MMRRKPSKPPVSALVQILLLSVCTGCAKKSDDSLIRLFANQRIALNQIVELARQDSANGNLHRFIFQTSARSEHPKISDTHWTEYQRLLSQIGLEGVAAYNGEVELRVESIAEYEKGIIFNLSSPAPLLDNLDNFSPSEETRTNAHGDYYGYRRLEPNWYIYVHYY